MSSKAGKTKRGWKFWVSAVGMAVAAGVLIWLVRYVRRTVDLRQVVAAMEPVWLLAAVLAVPIMEVIDALIFYSMGRRSGEKVRFAGCLATTFIGELYYRLGPAGGPVQLGLMAQAGFSGPVGASVYTWKCIANTVVYALYALAALVGKLTISQGEFRWLVAPMAVIVAGYVAICAVVAAVVAWPEGCARLGERFVRFLDKKVKWFRKLGKTDAACQKIRAFCGQVGTVWRNKALMVRLFVGMVAQLTLLFSIPALLYYGLGLRGAPFGELLLTQCMVMVLSRLVLLPGNAGGAEGSFYLFMAGYFGPQVVVAMVLWRLITFAEPMALGAFFSLGRAGAAWRKRAEI